MAGVCVCDVRALCTSCVRLEPHTTQCARAIRKVYWCSGCWPMCCCVSHQIRPSFMTFGTNCNRKARPSLCGLDAEIPWCPIDFLFLRHFHSNGTSLAIRWIISALPVRPVSFELRKEKTPRRQIYFFINETECLASCILRRHQRIGFFDFYTIRYTPVSLPPIALPDAIDVNVH